MRWFGKAIRRALKALPFIGSRTVPWKWFGLGLADERDYSALVGDGGGNSIVSACIQWMARNFPEAPPALWNVDPGTGVRQRVLRHAMLRVLAFPTSSPDRPGGFYSGVLLWMATIVSWVLDGNAYWLKVRSKMGRVVQLWYVPHWMMEPRWPDDGSGYISYYEYRVNGNLFKVSPDDVVHFRYGLNPENTRKGLSPLHAVLREVFTDEEAARFSASLLKNLGVPGVVLAPAPSTGPAPKSSQEDLKKIKEQFKETFSGDNRGEPMVMGAPMVVSQFGFSPQQMDLSAIRNVAEERVTAALGLPSAVVGFGAGLQHTKVGATMSELRDQAWQSNLIPNQRIMGGEIYTQLLPEFEADLEAWEFGFDLSRVGVLREAQAKLADYWAKLTNAKIAKRSEARAAFDLPIDPELDDLYIEATASATSGAPADGAPGGDQSQQIAELQQQVADLTAGKTRRLTKADQPPIYLTVNNQIPERSVSVDARSRITVPERQVVVDARTSVDPGAVVTNVDARTEVAKGAVQVNDKPDRGFDIHKDGSGDISVRPA